MSTEIEVIKKPKRLGPKSLIVGQRSWIAKHLYKELEDQGRNPEFMMKAEVGDERLRGATLYLIAGVARPTKEDMQKEIDLCERASKTGARIVYLSSCAVDRWEADSRPLSEAGELYVMGKRRCETIVTGGVSDCGYALRAPVIFGPGQRLESDMLLPTIIRHTLNGCGSITLNDPFLKFQMAYVTDVVRAMTELGDGLSTGYPISSLHTSPEISPIELVDLAAPGWSVFIPPRWSLHKDKRPERREIYHTRTVHAPFRQTDVTSTVQWYIDEVSQLSAKGTLLLEG